MKDQSLTPTQIRTVFYVVKKHKWKILTLFLLSVVTVAIGSLLVTPIYRASSHLLVKPGREDVYISPTGGAPAVIDYSAGQGEKIFSEIAILTNPGMVVELVDNFGVNRLFDFPAWSIKSRLLGEIKRSGGTRISSFFERIVGTTLFKGNKVRKIPPIAKVYESVRKNLRVSAIPRSNVIRVAFDWPDPVIAARVVNSLVELYLAEHVKVHTDPQTYKLLEVQAKKWEAKLRESEGNLEAFKRRHSIASLPQQKRILLEKLSEAEAQEKKTESDMQENLELISVLEVQLSDLDQKVQLQEEVKLDSGTITALKEKLVDLELQGLKAEVKQVKQMIAEEEKKERVVVVSGQSPIRQTLEADLHKAKARVESLGARKMAEQNQIVAYREELKNLDGFEKQMSRLEREVGINERNYKLYLTKFEEAKISESMDKQKIANVSVIKRTMPPLRPIKPKKRLIVLIGGFLGLFAGIGMAFLNEFIHPVFRTREDIDQFLGLPVLAVLPKKRKNGLPMKMT